MKNEATAPATENPSATSMLAAKTATDATQFLTRRLIEDSKDSLGDGPLEQ